MDRTDAELVQLLAVLSRKLGRYPVGAERAIEHRRDPTFPDAKTFDTRLGPRQRQLSMLIDLALSDRTFADLYPLLIPLVEAIDSAPGTAAEPPPVGWVYLMKSGAHYKIGHSNHVERRAYEVQLQLPEKVELIHKIGTDDPAGIEAYWHRRFATRRANGEWFLLEAADVAVFRRRDTM